MDWSNSNAKPFDFLTSSEMLRENISIITIKNCLILILSKDLKKIETK